MSKVIMLILVVAFTTLCAHAQTKIFKEVSDEISSQMKPIRQDNNLVGYLVFTQLEKASEDSFNYKISILDENLNDIGAVNFRDRNMVLQDVSFEQDVLCVAYVKGKFLGTGIKKDKDYREAKENKNNEVFIQYISLDGKILNTNSFGVRLQFANEISGGFIPKTTSYAYLEHPVQLKNISKHGFACFYGDGRQDYLLVLNPKGEVLWQKQLKHRADFFYLLTSGSEIYLLSKIRSVELSTAVHWGNYTPPHTLIYRIIGYSTQDTTKTLDYRFKGDRFNNLDVFAFENDPLTNKPYLAGLLTQEKTDDCVGVFTSTINGLDSEKITSTNTYWDSNTMGSEEESRSFSKRIGHTTITNAFRDFDGNTCFTASTYFAGAELIEQNADGKLALENNILSERTMPFRPGPSPKPDERIFYRLFNSDTKTSYLVIDDQQNVSIYNMDQKKVLRTIPHKDSGIKTNVYPAKEGYVMLSEYNRKEKYTKLSIEAL